MTVFNVHLSHTRITTGCLTITLSSIYLYILSTKTSQITISKYRSQKTNETNPQHNSYRTDVNSIKGIQSDWKVAQPKVWYLVLAKNECDEVELVDDYVGMTVQKLCKVTWPDTISVVALKLCVYQHVFFTSAVCSLNIIFNLNPIWNARMILGVPSLSAR